MSSEFLKVAARACFTLSLHAVSNPERLMPDPHTPLPPNDTPDLLPRYLALTWAGLTVYGSLYPFSGWQYAGTGPFVFLAWAWPQYWTAFDLAANIVVYMPMGFFLALSLRRLPGRASGVLCAICASGVLSLGMESLQTWLPSRFASNLDFACNVLGALLGSLIAAWVGTRLRAWWKFWRSRLIAPLPHVDLGLTLLGLWILTLLSPETLLFGVGDLRHTFGREPPALDYAAQTYHVAETAVVTCNVLALGLFVAALLRGRWRAYFLVPAFFAFAAVVCSLSAALLSAPAQFLVWMTPGAREGLLYGMTLLAATLLLPPRLRPMLAAIALLAGVLLVNCIPMNPYTLATLARWREGHFLNFNGLTRWISIVWPFLALPYLFFARHKENLMAENALRPH
ncbi:MAG: VanZ family protein [Zoogloeaceae bacterium]|nr:VanZ family protein [Zoogloeaceae bacterium]